MTTTVIQLKELYETDDSLWLEETIKLLKEHKFQELDLENLIEELESLARRDKLAMASLLEQIIRHLLLLEYWEAEYERNSNHWEAEIVALRNQLNDSMNPNFSKHLNQNLTAIYQKALRYTQRKSRLTNLPLECPYTLEKLLDQQWFPQKY
ncbi:MAG: DUF29 domain-containing protein [Gomphosphaeria aponina SAG 52.96 = DSM 107014]|uniref:DUF29 domain-containing protein n=1 Tax=Gomphosphaeria aponina SAG 52.96 = DSM 107014 TaxID=1521640 RepID=A0A941GSP0_9CHRO|nr:DUF29 domain-containing protein [Gomphosphaeria aponina SAG 52.96 = DSM 107014]